ncbi:MAG: bifunctional sugar-1-phosphate nucleotidylyltransferase/acetyltransferase [Candidatus Levyibacteriota bacterium]
MQAVILAAGLSSRFYPLASGMHKSMIKICGKPILEYTINGLKMSGIKDIVLVVSSTGLIESYFGNGEKFGVSMKYVIQPKPLGMGNALLLAEKNLKGDFLLLNASHVDIGIFAKKLIDAKSEENKSIILVKEEENTWKFGVVKLSGDRVEELIEKPKKGEEPSKLRVIGIYYFSRKFLSELKNTPQDHYQLEAAISSFAKKNYVKAVIIKEETITLKYSWDLLSVKNFIFKLLKGAVGKNVNIAKTAEIIGDVVIEDGAEILEGAKIKGPCYLGKNTYVGNHAVLRNNVDLGENSVVGAYMEVKNSIIMSNSKTHAGFIGDSIIDQNCRIGTQFCTANVRLDRSTVKVDFKGKVIDTGLKSLGMILGKNVRIGVKCSTMPGVTIGENAIVGPSTVVSQNVEANTKYYSKFQEIIIKK